MSGVYWGASRECRYSGARRVEVAQWGIWRFLGGVGMLGPLGHQRVSGHVGAVRGVLGASRECRYSGQEGV